MKRTAISAAVLGLILSAAAAPVSAQAIVSSPVRFGIMGGATIPLSDLSDEAKTGWNAGALVTFGVPLVPVSFRIDGQWHQMNGKDVNTLGGSSQFPDFRIIDGTANVVYTFGAAMPTKFYVIGGIGAYNERAHDPVDQRGHHVLTADRERLAISERARGGSSLESRVYARD
jgi:hypothetical protein